MVYRAYLDGTQFFASNSMDASQGICEARVKQEVNKASAFNFTMLPSCSIYNSINRYTSVITVKRDDEIIFKGRVIDISDSLELKRSVSCEGALAYLLDSVLPPQRTTTTTPPVITTYSNSEYRNTYYTEVEERTYEEPAQTTTYPTEETPREHFNRIIASHNGQVEEEKQFTIGTIDVEDIDTNELYDDASFRDSSAAITGDLLDFHGGYLMVTYDANGVQYINWRKQAVGSSTQPIWLGTNLVSIDKKLDVDNLFTVLIPIGKDSLNISSVQQDEAITMEVTEGIQRFGRIVKVVNFSEIDDAETLMTYGQKYIDRFYKPDKVSFTIRAVDLHLLTDQFDAFGIATNITIRSEPHGINGAYMCISMENDLLSPDNDTYTIGDPEETLTELYNSQKAAAESKAASNESYSSVASSNAYASAHACTFNKNGFSQQVYDDFSLKAETAAISAHLLDIDADIITIDADIININNGFIQLRSDIDDELTLYVLRADFADLFAQEAVVINASGGQWSTYSLSAAVITAADSVSSPNGSISGGQGLFDSLTINYNDFMDHYHTVAFDNGQFTLGSVTWTAPGPFDIADTAWFRSQISAAKAEVVISPSDITLDDTDYLGGTNRTLRVYIDAVCSDFASGGTYSDDASGYVDVSCIAAYNEGAAVSYQAAFDAGKMEGWRTACQLSGINGSAVTYPRDASTYGSIITKVASISGYTPSSFTASSYTPSSYTASDLVPSTFSYDPMSSYTPSSVGTSIIAYVKYGENNYRYSGPAYPVETYRPSTYTQEYVTYTTESYTASSYTAESYTAETYTPEVQGTIVFT